MPAQRSQKTLLIPAAVCGLFLYLPWLLPGSIEGSLLEWGGAIMLLLLVRRSSSVLPVYFCGVVQTALGFSWLYQTIGFFGGFPPPAAFAIFVLFVVASSVQYALFAILFRALPRALDSCAIRGALSWVAIETLPLRIFPWEAAHTQLALPLAQVAELGGTALVSFVLFWGADLLAVVIAEKRLKPALVLPAVALIACFIFGTNRSAHFAPVTSELPKLSVALVQGDISVDEKHDVHLMRQNIERYHELTRRVASPGLFVVWPESVIQDWIYAGIRHVNQDERLPRFPGVNLLVGSLSFLNRSQLFNSAFAIHSNGEVSPPGHKQILMPFGEYTPFGRVFPWLRQINATAGDFTPGKTTAVFEFAPFAGPKFTAGTTICYEDVVPSPAREAVQKGAEILVNMTNDAWFGRSLAPYAHNLIASFRAIENRRYLLRATNTGLSAVIDPLGRTVAALPLFSEGTILATVELLSYKTLYTRLVGEAFGWAIVVLCLLLAFARPRIWKAG